MQRTLTLWARLNPGFIASSPQLHKVLPLLLCNIPSFLSLFQSPHLFYYFLQELLHTFLPPAHLFAPNWKMKRPEVERENWLNKAEKQVRNPQFHDKGTKVPGKTDWKYVMMQRMCGEWRCESLHLQKHCSLLELMCDMMSLVFTRGLVIWHRELCYQI